MPIKDAETAMTATQPHYLLFCDGSLASASADHTEERGRWRFVLENVESGEKIEAADSEPSDHPDRTALLAVMRGLEALDQPSRVTLITTSRYVARGLQYGLSEWRENEYCWEHFGSVQPIRNSDLWRRVDGALRYHQVQCRWMTQETPGSHQDMERSCPVESPASPSPPRVPQPNLARTRMRSKSISSQSHHSKVEVQCPAPVLEMPTLSEVVSQCKAKRDSDAGIEEAVTNLSQPSATKSPKADLPRTRWFLIPVHWLWGVILSMDSFLVSCLRCMFLLDPRPDPFRTRKL